MFPNKHSLSQHQVSSHGMDISLESTNSSPGVTRGYPTSPAASRGYSPRAYPSSPSHTQYTKHGGPPVRDNFLHPQSQCDVDFDSFISCKTSEGLKFDAGSYGSCSDDDTDAYEDQKFEHETSMESFHHNAISAGMSGTSPKWPDGRLDQIFGSGGSLSSNSFSTNIVSRSRVLIEERKRKLDNIVTKVGGIGKSLSGGVLSQTPKDGLLGGLCDSNAILSRSGPNLTGCFDEADATMNSLSQLLDQDGSRSQQYPGRNAMPKLEAYLSTPSSVTTEPVSDRQNERPTYGTENKSPLPDELHCFDALMGDSNQSLPSLIKLDAVHVQNNIDRDQTKIYKNTSEDVVDHLERHPNHMLSYNKNRDQVNRQECIRTPSSLPDLFNTDEIESLSNNISLGGTRHSNDGSPEGSDSSADVEMSFESNEMKKEKDTELLMPKSRSMLDDLSPVLGVENNMGCMDNTPQSADSISSSTIKEQRGTDFCKDTPRQNEHNADNDSDRSNTGKSNLPLQFTNERAMPVFNLSEDNRSLMKTEKKVQRKSILSEHNRSITKQIKDNNYSDISDMSDREDSSMECDKIMVKCGQPNNRDSPRNDVNTEQSTMNDDNGDCDDGTDQHDMDVVGCKKRKSLLNLSLEKDVKSTSAATDSCVDFNMDSSPHIDKGINHGQHPM